jgi:hypothetical protein
MVAAAQLRGVLAKRSKEKRRLRRAAAQLRDFWLRGQRREGGEGGLLRS